MTIRHPAMAARFATIRGDGYPSPMADFERRATVGVDADAAFDFLADPGRLPTWVVGMTLDDAIAIEGDPKLQDEGEARPEAPEARFFPDRAARRVEWGLPGGEYAGEVQVQPMMAGMSTVTIRLHLPDNGDAAAIDKALDQTVKNLQRQLSSRP
jgi:hypothetical protein